MGPTRKEPIMKVRAAAESRHGASEDDAPARSPAPPGVDAEGLPAAAAQDHLGRPLPVAYLPMLALLVVIAAVYGLVVDDAYRLVSPLTRQTWRAQDAVTLTTVPVLLWATWRARTGSLNAHLVSVG